MDPTGPELASHPQAMSRAAILGGTTTLIDFAVAEEGGLAAACEKKRSSWDGAWTDFSLHVIASGQISRRLLDQIPEAISAGYPSFKVFTTNGRPSRQGLMTDMGSIRSLQAVLSKAGGILAAHAEDDELVMRAYQEHVDEGDISIAALPTIHSPLAEEMAVRRLLAIAEDIPNSRVYFMHLSSVKAIRAVAAARQQGRSVFGETLHNFLVFGSDKYDEPDGVLFHTYPALRTLADRAEMWNGLAESTLATVATDGNGNARRIKTRGTSALDAAGGHAGVETRIAVTYTEAVAKRGFSLSRFVDITSTNAARILGLFPAKGAIQPGSDADIILLDRSKPRRLSEASLHDSDYSIWDGYQAAAWPAMTLLRGQVVADRGKLVGTPLGEFTPRRLALGLA
jgi:dihydropyrimidinase